MKTTRTGFSVATLAAAILLLLPFAAAQDQNYPEQGSYDQRGYDQQNHDQRGYDQDPPTRAGRIGYVEGSVSFQPGGDGDWVTAVPNRPLTVGDNLWVDRGSRAEIQIGSTSIRLGPETSISFLNLGNEVTQLRLSLGSAIVRARRFERDDAIEMDTPNLALNVTRPGEYRLDVNQNGDQTVAEVYQGEAEISGAGNSYRLIDGQRGTFSGVDQLSYDVDQIGSDDDFYRWARSRDERQDRFRSARYVSTDMTGYEDLDDYGQWQDVNGYGNVWSPAGVPYDWAPYRYGHWAYVSPWGWTWVEDEPWGFAPFHYGRWAYLQSRWCWVPGPVAVAPVYAPALVAFIGGGGFSIGVGVGSGVGWFPLAPGEVYVPWYRTSPRYVQNVNVTNTRVNVVQVTNVYNNYNVNHVSNVTYVNQRVTNSVTVVNHDTFVNARPVNRNIVRVDSREIQRAQVSSAVVNNVQPARQSVIGVARPVNSRPPQEVMSRSVVATRQPVVASRPMDRPGMGRVNAPPVRTVRAVPVGQAQTLERGARGGAPPARTEAAPRANAPENNRPPAADMNRGNPRPSAPGNNAGASPNAPGNSPYPANNRGVPRPGGPDNRPAGAENRGNGRPNAPENNPAMTERPANRGNQSAPNNAGSNNARPNNAGPNNDGSGRVPRPNMPQNDRVGNPDNRPVAQPRNEAPRPSAPDNREMAPRQSSPEMQAPPDNRQAPRAPAANRQPPPMTQQQPRGNPNNNRPDMRPQESPRSVPPETRAPETRQAAPPPRPETRSEPAPRPEPRAAEPRPQSQNENKGNSGQNHTGKNDKEPPHYR
jgi:hypothetical protein